MTTVNALSEIAALMGDPARASMLSLLMDGRAHTASDLAHNAGITAQTASGHLARMVEANLLAAYSSNLFGIVCVALVKIRHVRPYKRQLIIEIQQVAA